MNVISLLSLLSLMFVIFIFFIEFFLLFILNSFRFSESRDTSPFSFSLGLTTDIDFSEFNSLFSII